MPETETKKITANHLPNLTKLSGYRIQNLIQWHQLKVLRIVGLCPSDFDLEKDWSLLRETSFILPNLTTLALSTTTQLMAIPRDICTFSNLVDLWYEELRDCTSHNLENQRIFVFEFLRVVLSALPKLIHLCIEIYGNGILTPPMGLLSSSQSLRQLTIQVLFDDPMAFHRLDINRKDVKSKWRRAIFRDIRWHKNFTL
ncbi:hypothetical protein FS842_008682 [Serendipita sp. 407]|nr:hypothetical protein FS842_008682 [Serendipita sp. 407]